MKQYIIDTNFLIRFLLSDNPIQTKITEKSFASAKRGEIYLSIPLVVIIESIFVLVRLYHIPKVEVADMLLRFINLSYIDIEKRDILLSVLILYRRLSFSITDLIVHVQAEKEGKELLTFDRKLKKLQKQKPVF